MALLIVYDAAVAAAAIEGFWGRESFASFLQFLVPVGKMVRDELDKSSWLGENIRRSERSN